MPLKIDIFDNSLSNYAIRLTLILRGYGVDFPKIYLQFWDD